MWTFLRPEAAPPAHRETSNAPAPAPRDAPTLADDEREAEPGAAAPVAPTPAPGRASVHLTARFSRGVPARPVRFEVTRLLGVPPWRTPVELAATGETEAWTADVESGSRLEVRAASADGRLASLGTDRVEPARAGTVDVVVSLFEVGSLRVRVLAPDGAPAPRAVVHAASMHSDQRSTHTTGEDGEALVQGLFGSLSLRAEAPGFGPSEGAATWVEPGASVRVDLSLVPAWRVTGIVGDEGRPLRGASVSVSAHSSRVEGETDAEGRFDLGPLPEPDGDLSVSVRTPDDARGRWVGRGTSDAARRLVELGRVVPVLLRPLPIRVIDEQGAPVGAFRVTTGRHWMGLDKETGADGRATLWVVSGENPLVAPLPLRPARIAFDPATDPRTERELVLAGSRRVRGRLVYEGAEPVSFAHVHVRLGSLGADRERVGHVIRQDWSKGDFEVRVPADARWTLRLETLGVAIGRVFEGGPTTGEVEIRLRPEEAPGLEVRVTDEADDPVPLFRLDLRSEGWSYTGLVGTGGMHRIWPVPPGPVTVTASAVGRRALPSEGGESAVDGWRTVAVRLVR